LFLKLLRHVILIGLFVEEGEEEEKNVGKEVEELRIAFPLSSYFFSYSFWL